MKGVAGDAGSTPVGSSRDSGRKKATTRDGFSNSLLGDSFFVGSMH